MPALLLDRARPEALPPLVVAEGVKTQAQADFLNAIGHHDAQGYLSCKPIEARELDSWLAARAALDVAAATK